MGLIFCSRLLPPPLCKYASNPPRAWQLHAQGRRGLGKLKDFCVYSTELGTGKCQGCKVVGTTSWLRRGSWKLEVSRHVGWGGSGTSGSERIQSGGKGHPR